MEKDSFLRLNSALTLASVNDLILGVVWAIAELSLVENNNNNNNNNNILMKIIAKREEIVTFFNAVATVYALTANSKDDILVLANFMTRLSP